MNEKILAIFGSQPRHMSILHKLISSFNISGIILCHREIVPQLARPKVLTNLSDKRLLKHLEKLKQDEFRYLGERIWDEETADLINKYKIPVKTAFDRDSLNSAEINNFARQIDFDAAIDYGSWIIEAELMQTLTNNERKIYNIHGGISPFFKGSSTLLWSLVLGQPELMGFTIHSMNENIDDGLIYSYIFPDLVGCNGPTQLMGGCQKGLYEQVDSKFQTIFKGEVKPMPQPTMGSKLFLEKDFRIELIEHLYTMYSRPFSDSEIDNLQKDENFI